jgi:hypothetical protein
MKTFLVTILLGVSLLAGSAGAQGYGYREPLFDRIQSDLSRTMEHAYARDRVSHAESELARFQAERAAGRFAGHRFHKAMNALDSVVRGNGIDPRDREMLARDLQNLRAFGAANRY